MIIILDDELELVTKVLPSWFFERLRPTNPRRTLSRTSVMRAYAAIHISFFSKN